MTPILAQYIPVAQLLVKTFGQNCEVVLHDLSTPQHSVIYVANGHVTGRKIGDNFHHLVSKALETKNSEHGVIANYYFEQQGKLIRSSSLLIRNLEGEAVGALCINLDTTELTQQISSLLGQLPGWSPNPLLSQPLEKETTESAKDSQTVVDMVRTLIDNIIQEAPPGTLTRNKRLELIRFMDNRGVFLMKGAIDHVANRMALSKVTVYSYLDEIRGKR